MLRRNPDAVAVCVIGLFLLAGSAPRYLIEESRWRLTPVRSEMRMQKEDLRMLHEQIRAQKEAIRQSVEEVRRTIR